MSTVVFPADDCAVRLLSTGTWTRGDRNLHSLPATAALLAPLVVHLRVPASLL